MEDRPEGTSSDGATITVRLRKEHLTDVRLLQPIPLCIVESPVYFEAYRQLRKRSPHSLKGMELGVGCFGGVRCGYVCT